MSLWYCDLKWACSTSPWW